MPDHPHVLVATLGGQPQIVTFTLDLLLQRGFPIAHVFVIHPRTGSQPRLHRSLMRLYAEFPGDYYQAAQRTIHFHSYALELDGHPIDDITNEDHADGTLNTIHQLIGDLKRQGYRIHLSVTGGRRLMALLATSVASFNFDRHDPVWHLYTPDTLKPQVNEGALMHFAPELGIKLIQRPFVALGGHIYPLAQPFRDAQQEQRAQAEAEEREQCQKVVALASPAQLKVLRLLARGLRPQQIADELCITLATVNDHKSALLGYCRNVWNISPKERLDYHFLRAKFTGFFQEDE